MSPNMETVASMAPGTTAALLRIVAAWNLPPADASGAVDTLIASYTFGNQSAQNHRLIGTARADTAFFALPAPGVLTGGLVCVTTKRRAMLGPSVCAEASYQVADVAPGPVTGLLVTPSAQ